jgi:hypothetical protein
MSLPKFNSPEELSGLINQYFDTTTEERLTWTGLCLALDTNKQTLLNYQKIPEYEHIITMAKLRVENAYELSLRKNGRSGDIFGLKNFGWSDKQEIEHTGKDGGPIDATINIIGVKPKE